MQRGAAGLAVNPALALGTPTVIAAEYESDVEIRQHGITAWSCAKGNIEGLVGQYGVLCKT